MKTRNWAIGCMLVALAGCQQRAEDTPAESRTVSLEISAGFNLDVEIGNWEPEVDDELTIHGEKAKSRAEKAPATRMAFVLIDENGETVVSQEKGDDEEDYLTLRAEVPVGTYQLIAFAHNGSSNATIGTDAVISFPGKKLTDSFLYYGKMKLDESIERYNTVNLKRCVSYLAIRHTDKIPANTASVEITVSGAGNVLDAATGFASEACEQTVKIDVPSTAVNTSLNNFILYTFLTEKESEVDLHIVTKDTEGNVMTDYELPGIPVMVNVKTTCKGVLFHAGQNISVTFDTEWGEDKNVDF